MNRSTGDRSTGNRGAGVAAGNTGGRYDRTTIWLHWLTASLVVVLWLLAQVIDYPPRGAPRVPLRSLHITFGVALAVVLAVRIWWRLTRGRGLPAADRGVVHAIAKATHWGLYLLLGTTVVLGLCNVWVRGDTIWFLFTVPAFDASNTALRRFVGTWHATLADAVLIVAGFHALAALAHHYLWRDGVLRRMLLGTPDHTRPVP